MVNVVAMLRACGDDDLLHDVICSPDRDQYVEIRTQNVIHERLENFAKKSVHEINSLGQPYDLQSIMHYKHVCTYFHL